MFSDNKTTERLDFLHSQITDIYLWWHENAPEVHPKETGLLAELWDEVDRLTPVERAVA